MSGTLNSVIAPGWCASLGARRRAATTFVNGRRTDHNCAALLKKLAGARVNRFHTDKWESYRKLLPRKKHAIDKEGTRNIERRNLNCRTHIKR